MKNPVLSGISTQERKLLSNFSANEKLAINVENIIAIHPCSRKTANQILSRLTQKGWLQRLRHGLYALVPISATNPNPVIEEAWPLAMEIFSPAFISGWSAAEHWDFTEQIFNSVSVVTKINNLRKTNHEIGGIKYRTRTVSENRFFGNKTIWLGNKPVEIADPARMIIDILDLPRFGGGGRHIMDVVKNYWKSNLCEPEKLLDYALRYKRGAVLKRLGFLAEECKAPVSLEWLNVCQKNLSKGISYFDPDGPKSGKIVSKWNISINLPL